VFLGAFLGFKLGDGSEKVAQLFKAVVAGIKFTGTVVDLLAYAAKVGPARFVGDVINRVAEQL